MSAPVEVTAVEAGPIANMEIKEPVLSHQNESAIVNLNQEALE